ncbi:hypothetical protein [Rathayibacter sp. AY1D7]|uniref:hypothetical protein n=1 Tax=Rathayibacter sp. AY1D7 TaxID=2080547 RepID=UPI0011AFE83D|nr:hypothetical protein [Rathayibacter sp. AY1D7]
MDHDWPLLGPDLNDDFGGDFTAMLADCYAQYEADFLNSSPSWPIDGKRFAIKRQPLVEGQCHTYWHIISEGDDEETRSPVLARCERVGWPRELLNEFAAVHPAASSDRVCWWAVKRGSELRFNIALADFSYLVVVADRGDYVLLWTAFPIEHSNRRRKLQRQFDEYWASR